jgi:formamidase
MKSICIDRDKMQKDDPGTGHNRWYPDLDPIVQVGPGEELLLETRDTADGQIRKGMTVEDPANYDPKGAHLFIPVAVDGALFSVGDGHYAQGDGEACLTAIETGATAIVRFFVHKGQAARHRIRWPYFSHPGYYVAPEWSVPRNCVATIGTPVRDDGVQEDGDLSLACRNALVNMIELLQRRGYTRDQAYVICSVAVDLRITNLVNTPNVAVSALLSENIFSD